MKKTLVILFSTISTFVSAQDIVISAGAEKTVAGTQYGATMMYETKKVWGAGPFYQTSFARDNGEKKLKNPFYGIAIQAPLARSERISLIAAIRTGLINEKFLVVVPSLETRIKMTSKAGVSVGAGLRSGFPSIAAKLFVRLF
jgi:hypothetical protein